MAESFPQVSGAIIRVEVGGRDISYDDDPLVWEAFFIQSWNRIDGIAEHSRMELSAHERKLLKARLTEPEFTWKQAFAKGPYHTPSGTTFSLGWFLAEGTCEAIMHRKYEKPNPRRKLAADNEAVIYPEEPDA
jgi:hypothetical protein